MASGTIEPISGHMSPEITAIVKPSQYVLARVLAAGVAEAFTVPANGRFVLFSASGGADIYVNYTAAAAVPVADNTTGTAPEMNPALRFITADMTSISVISPVACIVTASFWRD